LQLLDLRSIEAEIRRRKRRKLERYFPDDGPLRRELYVKHTEFFAAGAEHRERMFCAGNRVGKTITGAYETALHLTGLYPAWWVGRRFSGPIDAWVAGQTASTTRDVVQLELCGKFSDLGTGMIPFDCIVEWTKKTAPKEAYDTLYIKHVSGGISSLGFKSYAEGPGNFQGTAKHLIWFDEECDIRCYAEAMMRTAVLHDEPAGGIVMVTFTPLLGWTEVVDSFLGRAEGVV
jgi:phage terminase large subunit-like protein